MEMKWDYYQVCLHLLIAKSFRDYTHQFLSGDVSRSLYESYQSKIRVILQCAKITKKFNNDKYLNEKFLSLIDAFLRDEMSLSLFKSKIKNFEAITPPSQHPSRTVCYYAEPESLEKNNKLFSPIVDLIDNFILINDKELLENDISVSLHASRKENIEVCRSYTATLLAPSLDISYLIFVHYAQSPDIHTYNNWLNSLSLKSFFPKYGDFLYKTGSFVQDDPSAQGQDVYQFFPPSPTVRTEKKGKNLKEMAFVITYLKDGYEFYLNNLGVPTSNNKKAKKFSTQKAAEEYIKQLESASHYNAQSRPYIIKSLADIESPNKIRKISEEELTALLKSIDSDFSLTPLVEDERTPFEKFRYFLNLRRQATSPEGTNNQSDPTTPSLPWSKKIGLLLNLGALVLKNDLLACKELIKKFIIVQEKPKAIDNRAFLMDSGLTPDDKNKLSLVLDKIDQLFSMKDRLPGQTMIEINYINNKIIPKLCTLYLSRSSPAAPTSPSNITLFNDSLDKISNTLDTFNQSLLEEKNELLLYNKTITTILNKP